MKHTLLLFILGLAFLLRFYALTSIPPSLSHDEAAIAYNAYSILKTGKDEYGKSFPILFQSFDDYKLPAMVYSTIPFVALFGPSELAARLPSALYGLLAVVMLYLLIFQITKQTQPALFASFFLAIQPWHVNFSRQLFESNGAVFWFIAATYFLFRSTTNYHNIIVSGLCFVASLYFYYSVRLVIPFVLVTFTIYYWKLIINEWKITLLALLLSAFAFLPIGLQMLSPGGLERISIVSVTNDPNYIQRREQYIKKLGTNPTIFQKIIYNRRVALIHTAIENYGKNISYRNLFVAGTGTYGALYPFELLLTLLGIYYLKKFPKYILLTWLVCGFLPGAFSINQPNTLRTLIAAPVFAIFSGFGMYYVYKKYKYSLVLLALALLFYVPKFLYAYFVDNPSNNAIAFADGNKQMVEYVKTHEDKYDNVVISGYYWRPYIFMLYWGDTNPTEYQKNGFREHFGKYTFTSASWDTSGPKLMDPTFTLSTLSPTEKTLFILSPEEFKIHEQYLQKIDTINGRITKDVYIASALK